MKTAIFALMLALLLPSGIALAGEKVWVALYLAENSTPPANSTEAPEKLHKRLQAVFGFKHYKLVKSQEFELGQDWEHWAVPRKDVFLRLQPLPDKSGRIAYELYNGSFRAVKGVYETHADTPLFITGPPFKNGQLVFVLESR